MDLNIRFSVADRLMRYVAIDTQSDPESSTCPSTPGQKDLGTLLVNELKSIGISDAEIDGNGYVYASIPSNSEKHVPTICFCSHMDTSPDCSGKDVKPILHTNYQGGDIVLPADRTQVIREDENPELKNQIGNDIITANGTTLLGADNKAGIASIMNAAEHLVHHPEIKHGRIRILFTPDEEIGRGVDKVNLEKLHAEFGYTIDGETLGSIEDETFSADEAVLTLAGFNIHPGFAIGRMENAIKITAEILELLPKKNTSPETTKGREGFIHPISITGDVEKTILKFIIRSFDENELSALEKIIEDAASKAIKHYRKASYQLKINEQYRNMKQVLDKHPQVVAYAEEAIRRTGVSPKKESIRGGTDGSRLSFMGLPCPNLFAGGHAFHSKLEWASVQDMQKTVETIIHLCMIWEEKS